MRYFLLTVAFLILTGAVWGASYRAGKVLSLASTPSPTPTPMPSPSPSPTPSPTPTSAPKPSPIPSPPPPPVSPQEIHAFIERFSGQYGVSPDVLRYIAICESGFNPLAQNAGYAGLYQFDTTTWKNYRILIGEDPDPILRLNAEEAVQTAAFVLSLGKTSIWPNCAP